MTVERVTVERVAENPTFPEPEIVYALPEQVFVTPEITPDPEARPFAPPAPEATRQKVVETTATVLPLEPEPEPMTPMTPPIAVPVPIGAAERPSPEAPPTAVPVPDGTAERPSPETPPREVDAAPPPKSQGGDTPLRLDSPTTSGKSTPGTQNTNPEKVSVVRRLELFKVEIAKRGAPQKEQSKGAEKGAANPVAGKGRAPDGQFPKPKAPAKGVKIPKAPVR